MLMPGNLLVSIVTPGAATYESPAGSNECATTDEIGGRAGPGYPDVVGAVVAACPGDAVEDTAGNCGGAVTP